MIRLSQFDLVVPESIEKLKAMMDQTAGDAKLLAGGTDLLVNIKRNLGAPKNIIWLGRIAELRSILVASDGSLIIGTMCSLNMIEHSDIIEKNFPALKEAVRTIASPQIRNQATIGGNLCLDTRCTYYNQSEFWRSSLGGCLKLNVGDHGSNDQCHAAPGLETCHAVFCSDLAPLLIALNAKIRILSSSHDRTINLAELYDEDGKNHLVLGKNEFIREVILPPQQKGKKAIHRKLRLRDTIDFPLVNVGISVRQIDEQTWRDVRVVVGAVASKPIMVEKINEVFENEPVSEKTIQQAASIASSMVSPLANQELTVGYRKRIVTELVVESFVSLLNSPATRYHGKEDIR